jgi:N-acetylmuramoyl-L-alanine amidase
MKRFLPLLVIALLAAASILLAQPASQATLRLPAGDKAVTTASQNGQTYFSAEEVVIAMSGTIARDSNGFRVTVGNSVAAFAPDSRFGVIRDDLIEMPVPPIVIDGKPYVPWQFFQGFLSRASDQEVLWDGATRVLTIRPQQHNAVGVQVSVANIQGISKIVVTTTAPVDYAIIKEQGAYTVRFKSPIRAPFVEQAFEDANVAKVVFAGTDLKILLTAPDVAGDAYKLENPFRIILDLRKGAAAPLGVVPPSGPSKPVDLPGIHTIVIDPGHGGREVGAIGPGGLMEKDATLAVCRKLAEALSNKLRARVVLTRTDDSVVSLDQRTAIANQYHADLFLSVHMNAAIVKGAKGSETYFLSADASDELAKKAAELENAASKATASQPAASSDLKLILWDLAQQDYLVESERLAKSIQEEMNGVTGVTGRGVKQAPFKVLVGATMPAALVEVAFITNPDEESKINSEAFQNVVVEALTRAVDRYKTEYETRIGVIQPAPPAAPATTTTTPAATPPPATATTTTRTGT